MAIGLLARLRRFHYDCGRWLSISTLMLVHGLHMLNFAIR
jgi:hypothetical protein